MDAPKQVDLFFVRRNKNKNEVHYALQCDAEGKPLAQEPIRGYWQMHEKGPGVTEPITVFEQMAFGIESQKFDGDAIILKLRAFPERLIRIAKRSDSQAYKPYITINNADAELTSFYVFADETLFLPKVKYIEIHGLAGEGGARVTEKILKS